MRSILSNTRNVDHVRFNLTFVRHAETHANAEGIIQGLLDTELSNIGHLQSKALGRYLQYHRFSHIYSSDLKRASETARHIHLLNHVSSCEIKFNHLLRERTYGIAQGRTRQWLHELAKENGVAYSNFTPPGAETTAQVRERAIKFFQNLCQELLIQFNTSNLLSKQNKSYSISLEDLFVNDEILNKSNKKRSVTTGNLEVQLSNNIIPITSCRSSIDSALDLSSLSSDQQSTTSSSFISSSNSSLDKLQTLNKDLHSPYENHFSDLDVLVITHGAVIREFIKYFTYDLHTDIGQYFNTIQELAPNTSITRFQVTYSENFPTTKLQLIDYHNKTHLTDVNNDEYNLDVTNKCSL